MKLNSLLLAITVSVPMIASAGVTVTPLIGVHSYGDAETHQRKATATTTKQGVGLYTKETAGGAVGVEITPKLAFEADYLGTQTKASNAKGDRYDASQDIISGNFLIGTSIFNVNELKPYVLVGAGHSMIYAKPIGVNGAMINRKDNNLKTSDTVANLGLGAHYRINDTLALRGEARAIRNIDHDWWETAALAGVQMTFGGHLGNNVVAPYVPEVQPIVIAPRLDADQDGVFDELDKCPNTPINYVVAADGCPKQLTEAVSMNVKVLFNTNKSLIKPQYKSEVAKVASMMKEYSDSVAIIEGHTDSKGSAMLNTRLSNARAAAIKSMLINEFGIDASRLSSEGFGGSRPIASNSTAAGRAENRRVVATLSGNKTSMETK